MTKAQETLGQRLRRLREQLGLSPEKLAERAGVPLVSYRNWEYDHRVPGLGAASLLARALGVPLQDLADCVEAQEDRRHQPRRSGGSTTGEGGEENLPERSGRPASGKGDTALPKETEGQRPRKRGKASGSNSDGKGRKGGGKRSS